MSDDNVKLQNDNKTEQTLYSTSELNANFLPQIYDIIRWYEFFILKFLNFLNFLVWKKKHRKMLLQNW